MRSDQVDKAMRQGPERSLLSEILIVVFAVILFAGVVVLSMPGSEPVERQSQESTKDLWLCVLSAVKDGAEPSMDARRCAVELNRRVTGVEDWMRYDGR